MKSGILRCASAVHKKIADPVSAALKIFVDMLLMSTSTAKGRTLYFAPHTFCAVVIQLSSTDLDSKQSSERIGCFVPFP